MNFTEFFSKFFKMFLTFNQFEFSTQVVQFIFIRKFSFFISESNVSIMNFGKTIRNEKKKIENEYFEKMIFIYVDKNFEKFKNNRIIDFRLWKTIHYDFDMFHESTWKLFQKNQWKLIQNVCYFQKYWLNHSNIKKFRQIIMHKAIKQNDFHKWTMNQINWTKNENYSLFSSVVKQKIELLQKLSHSVSSTAVVNQKSIVFDENQSIASIVHQRQH